MSNSSMLKKRYEEFKFRCRDDHFLRSKLLNARRDEIVEIARELGYNFDAHEFLRKKKNKKHRNSRNSSSSLSPHLLGFIQIFLRSFSKLVSARD